MRRIVPLIALILLFACPAGAQEAVDSDVQVGPWIFGALRARSIGPAVMGGRVTAIDVVEDDRNTIYIGAACGGIWRSVDGGTDFDPVFDDYSQSIGTITIDQRRPDTVWVGTGEPWTRNSVSVGTGLYRTVDGGSEWELMGLENTERIGDIIIDPRSPDTVYVAALGHLWNANEERGLYKTEDGGKTWEKVLYVDENTGCTDIAIDPQEPDIVYAAMWEFRRKPYTFNSGGPGSGLYKSTDAGKTWKKAENGLPEGNLGRIALAIAPSRPNVVYAVVESEKTALYKSQDLGETWVNQSDDSAVKDRPFYFSLILVDPQDYNRIYKPSTGLSISRDGGKTFSGTWSGVHPDYHAIWIDPNDPDFVIVGTDGGVYVSYNRAISFRYLNNLPISQFYQVSCDRQDPYNVYGGLQDNGQWFGPSRSPGGIEAKDWESIGFGDGFHTCAHRADNNIIYWEMQGGWAFRKNLKTGEQKAIQPQPGEGDPDFRFNWNTPIVLSPNDPDAVYIGSQFLFRSTDMGDSWERLSDDLTTNDPEKQRQRESGGLTVDNTTAENHCTIYTIAESPLDGNIIWVGTDDGNIQVTDDGGKSWTNVVSNIDGLPDATWCSSVEPSHHDRATAYATFDGHQTGDMTPYVFMTTNLGRSWISVANDSLTGYCHVIRDDLVKPELLFLGSEFGLFVSIDRGQHWVHYKEDFPKVSVHDLVIQPDESDLVIATHGRGVYIIDNIAPLRQITDEVLAEEVHMFDSEPYEMKTFNSGQEFSGSAEFVGSNPSEVAKVTYYLKKRHVFGDMRIEIINSDGEVVKTLPGSKRKGINRVNWRMRLKPPKAPSSKSLAGFGISSGPLAEEGTYTVKLTKGKDTYESSLNLVHDPDLPHSAEDRALQQETVMRLYRLQERLAYIADALKDINDMAKKQSDDLKEGDGLRKDLESYVDDVSGLRESILITEDVQGIPGLADKLLDRVVFLYGFVSMYMGKPSDSQIKQVGVLEKEIDATASEFEKLTGDPLAKINSKLERKGLKTIQFMTRDEYENKES